MLFPENIDEYQNIDEVSLAQGELYTFVTVKFHNVVDVNQLSVFANL